MLDAIFFFFIEVNSKATVKEIAKKWKSLTQEEKEPYRLKYDTASQEYRKKLAEWKEKMVQLKTDNMQSPLKLAKHESEKLSNKETKAIKTVTRRK